MTGAGWLVVLAIIGFFIAFGLTILPIQLAAYKVRSSLKGLEEVPHITKKTKKEIVTILMNQFNIEGVDVIKPEYITYKKEKGVLTVQINYENRKTFIKPFDITGVYNEEIRIVER